ncbi:MAG: hypothetical protein AABX82_05055 [Nanoarchaeota archaeon]
MKQTTTKTSHQDQVEEWANFVRENPDKWKAQHTKFINAQIKMANEALQRIRKQKNGKEKIVELFSVKNKQLIASL